MQETGMVWAVSILWYEYGGPHYEERCLLEKVDLYHQEQHEQHMLGIMENKSQVKIHIC